VLSRVRPALALLLTAVILTLVPALLAYITHWEAKEAVAMVAEVASMVGSAIALVSSSFLVSVAANAVPG